MRRLTKGRWESRGRSDVKFGVAGVPHERDSFAGKQRLLQSARPPNTTNSAQFSAYFFTASPCPQVTLRTFLPPAGSSPTDFSRASARLRPAGMQGMISEFHAITQETTGHRVVSSFADGGWPIDHGHTAQQFVRQQPGNMHQVKLPILGPPLSDAIPSLNPWIPQS